jgi:hypothetical protein
MEVLGVRNDALAARSGADGDYTPIATDAAGVVKVAMFHQTDLMMAGVVQLTPKIGGRPGGVATAFANIAASQTDGVIVAAVASKKIRVLAAYMVTGATATNVEFKTKPAGAGSTISALFANAANGGAVLPFNPVGWFETNSGEGLTLGTGAGSTTGVGVVYVEV